MSIDLDAIRARLARVAGKWPTTGTNAPGADEIGPKAWIAHGPLRCHATERGRARQWSQACADADFIASAPADIAALLAEVERLRGERAAVVAWLRAWQGQMDDRITHDDADYAIRVIERGEHRREGED